MRRILITAAILSLALLLSACGDESGNPTDAPGNTSDMNDMGTDDTGAMGHDGEENTPMVDGAREIAVGGTSFAFDPQDITIEAGEDITIVLTAEDILHDFTVEGADGHVAADAGETASGGLRIEEPGTYTFYCSVEGHREAGMEGTLVVE